MKAQYLAVSLLAFAVPASAQSSAVEPYTGPTSSVLQDPCDRGPWPKVNIINGPNAHFVAYLQQMRPNMPIETAYRISDQLCSDMSLVGDSVGMTTRLRGLLMQHGY